MNLNYRRSFLSVEVLSYALLVALALGLRLYNLGGHPLNDEEARQALAVLAHVRGETDQVLVPASPAYFFFTWLSFFLFGASEATARVGPALAGSALVLVPALVRDRLGRGGALAASALLALSSTLVAASRSADGSIFAALGLALGLAALWRFGTAMPGTGAAAWLVVAGVALGLGLTGGGTIWLGLLALAITLAILRWTQPDVAPALAAAGTPAWVERRTLLAAVALSTLLIATIFFTHLRGVGVLVASWVEWWASFVPGTAGRAPGLMPLFVVVYEPLLLGFGIVGAIRAFRSGQRVAQALAWFSLAAFALVMVYSGRELSDLVWVAGPLAALAGWAIYDLLAELWAPRDVPLVGAQVGVSAALVAFALLNVATFAELNRGGVFAPPAFQVNVLGATYAIPAVTQLGVAGLALGLVLVIAYLFALGWSLQAAHLGLALIGLLLLGSMTLGAGWGVTQLRAGSPAELWWEVPASRDVWRLMDTLGDVSNYTVGNTHDIEVLVQGPATSSLGWQLRHFPHATFVEQLGPEMNSPVVITPVDEQHPTLGSAYVGQDFDLESTWTPSMSLPQWVGWLAYRRAPTIQDEPVILWVRQDVQQLTSTGN